MRLPGRTPPKQTIAWMVRSSLAGKSNPLHTLMNRFRARLQQRSRPGFRDLFVFAVYNRPTTYPHPIADKPKDESEHYRRARDGCGRI